MKKVTNLIIALVIFLTGYCPSILNGTRQTMASSHFKHSLNFTSSHQQMSCCEGEMPELVKAVTNINPSNEMDQTLFIATSPQIQITGKINFNKQYTYSNSSPPHLFLTGTTIMRE